MEKLVTKYAKQAGIARRVTCRSLRHTFATEKAKYPSVAIFQPKESLGHENIQTTQIYVHLARQDASRLMKQTSLCGITSALSDHDAGYAGVVSSKTTSLSSQRAYYLIWPSGRLSLINSREEQR